MLDAGSALETSQAASRPMSRVSESSVLGLPDDEWSWQLELSSLACDLLDASALVRGAGYEEESLLEEAPEQGFVTPRAKSTGHPFRDRLRAAAPASGMSDPVDWSRLLAVEDGEVLAASGLSGSPERVRKRPQCVEVNSGGQVFFGLLAPTADGGAEEAVVFKFCNSRHRRQSEQMAAELAWSLGVRAPASRLLLRAHDEEWRSIEATAGPLCESIGALLATKQSMLVMQFIPGLDMVEERRAWEAERLAASATALGQLLVLDMLLGNADRLPLRSLGWRGNAANLLWGTDGSCAPIDALVARRPPRLLVKDEDQKVHRLLELVLLDAESAHEVLLEAVSCNAAAGAAVQSDWEARQSQRQSATEQPSGAASSVNAVKAFHEGVRAALDSALRERGLLEMIVGVIRLWFEALKSDMRQLEVKADWRNHTQAIKKIGKEAETDERVKESWFAWQEQMRERTRSLSQAVDAWARERNMQSALSFKGFIGNSVLNPVLDAYELLVRLEHLVARLHVMADAGQVTRPCSLSPYPLLVGPATAAACFHLMRKLGVTAILDCTADLQAPEEAALGKDICWRRLSLEDSEDQDLSSALEEGMRFIDEAAGRGGGRVLVHCHEGRSRSVSLCLAYLVTREKKTLSDAMAFVKARRPQARPNAGFWRQLMALELSALGCCSVAATDAPRGKPKALVCDVCGEAVGLTEASLAGHRRLKHEGRATPAG